MDTGDSGDRPGPAMGRASFRFRVDGGGIRAVVDGESFPVLDLGSGGMAIRVGDRSRFVRGETLGRVLLVLGDRRLEGRGRVVHITRTGEAVVCGIALLDMDPGSESVLQAFLAGRRDAMVRSG